MNSDAYWVDPKTRAVILNDTVVPNDQVMTSLMEQHPEIATIIRWTTNVQSRNQSLFERDKYILPMNPFRQMKTAYEAVQMDDVVSNVIESTEAMAFSKMSFEAEDEDEQDVWNQIAADLDLDSRFREMWREQSTVSQFYMAVWWGKKSYKVRGKSDKGVSRKKTFNNLTVPTGLMLLDPLKIVPVGNFAFNNEQLAYIATRTESEVFYNVLAGTNTSDLMVSELILGQYEPDQVERIYLADLEINPEYLWLLNPKMVWRHTDTRPAYERFANLRMKSIFEILDLKRQLREMDRATLIGAALRVDQRVATPNGWAPIGSLVPGDEVFGADGLPTIVRGVFPQGVRPMYEMEFADGETVVCDADHRWAVARGRLDSKNVVGRRQSRHNTRILTTKQIMAEGLRFKDGRYRHRIPLTISLQMPEADLPLDPYLLGYLLGDGHLGTEGASTPNISSAEDSDFPWEEVLPDGARATSRNISDGKVAQYGLCGPKWTDNANPVTQGLRQLGIHGLTDKDKYIPDEYLWASEQQRWALLQGLLDSDGSYLEPGVVEFSSVSRKLVDGVRQLVQSLGNVANGSTCESAVRQFPGGIARLCAEYHRLWISIHQQDAPFRLKRKVAKWRPRSYPYVRSIRSIREVDAAEAVCIKVANDDGLFLTEGMAVTHNTSFIVLVKIGSDQHPGTPAEVGALAGMVRTQARVPVMVGDSRLSVEIITPKTDHTLQPDRYNVLDSRIESRLYQMFLSSNAAAGRQSDDSLKMARVIGRGLEGRRHQLNRAFHKNVVQPIYDRNAQFVSGEPKLVFHPKMIALDYDPAFVTLLQDLRDRGDLSRASILDQFDFDQDDEARKREMEADKYDEIMSPPNNVPYSGPQGLTPAAPGRAGGGNRNGGGSNVDSRTPNSRPVNPRQGNND